MQLENKVKATILAALVAVSCGAGEGGPPARSGADQAAAGAAPRRGTAAIAFEAKKAGSKPFPFGFVEGKVGDQPTRFILDTGASVHTIDPSVATAAKLPSPIKASSTSIEGFGNLPDNAAISVVELPAAIRAHGIGGILAPQLLVDRGQAVVVDLANRQLRSRPKSTAWSEMDDFGVVLTPPAQRQLCAVDSGGIAGAGRLLATDASVEGEATRLAIDTGSSRSLLLEGSKGGARATAHPVLGRSVVMGASGETVTAIYGGVPLSVGAWSGTVDLGLAAGTRHPQCGYEGRLGIDVLQQCAIAMTAEEFLVACRAPSK